MLRLTNIKRTTKNIEANYTPENSSEQGFISLDRDNGDVLQSVLTEDDAVTYIYFRMAKEKLLEIMNDKDIRDEYLVMWY